MIIIGFLLFVTTSCFQNRTYLTDEEKSWNPYKIGQVLVFESSNFEKDTIIIEDIEFGFPDGFGIVDYYEIMSVVARHDHFKDDRKASTHLLTIAARTEKRPSYIEFGVEVKSAQFIERQRYAFKEVGELPEIHFTVPYGSFDDVIAVGNKKEYPNIPTAIEILYWSKSVGYIRFDKYDGTSWKLVEIVMP